MTLIGSFIYIFYYFYIYIYAEVKDFDYVSVVMFRFHLIIKKSYQFIIVCACVKTKVKLFASPRPMARVAWHVTAARVCNARRIGEFKKKNKHINMVILSLMLLTCRISVTMRPHSNFLSQSNL